MDKNELIELAKQYIHTIFCIEDMRDGGIFAVYGLEQQRISIHEKLCNMIGLDIMDTKDICLYLDDQLGINFSKGYPSESDLTNYAIILVEKLQKLTT